MSNEDHSVCDSCAEPIDPTDPFYLIDIFVGNDWEDLLTFCKDCKPHGPILS